MGNVRCEVGFQSVQVLEFFRHPVKCARQFPYFTGPMQLGCKEFPLPKVLHVMGKRFERTANASCVHVS